MSVYTVRAPHPGPEAVMILPTPEFGDSERPESKVLVKTALNGRLFTYVSRQADHVTYRWEFQLTRMKALEFFEFARLYIGDKWEIERDEGTIVGMLKVNPVELDMAQRAVVAGSKELVPLNFEFESVQ